ncbi:MAG TPA: DUF2147 domain-containing protein [Rhodobacteraceae bacterium]|nr:DUF2147 domain-containing protein [Paracoccaceae bacterium]
MKKLLIGLFMLIVTSVPALADPLEGMWKTDVDDGAYAYVEIKPCGPALCGTIVRTFNSGGEYKSPNLGKRILIDMMPKGGGKYAGNVWRPANGKIYIGKIALKGNTLKMKGCVAGGLFCKSSTWTRLQ